MILSEERLADRARDLEAAGLTGFALVYVSLEPVARPGFAWLDLEFHNANGLAVLPPVQAFRIEGGLRLRAGTGPGQVQVTEVLPNPEGRAHALRLRVAPVGDYSTYTLSTSAAGLVPPADALPRAMDPLFGRLPFKFRPGCFNLNCAPTWAPAPVPEPAPAIDYLARDYDSFRHVLMATMAQRVPGWAPTSEADLDQVLIDLIAAQADELADHHDRVIAERSIVTAHKRESFARHGRWMDYHLHQGNQASTWVAVQALQPATDLPALAQDAGGNLDEWAVWNGADWRDPEAVIFALPHEGPRWRRRVYRALNELRLYTWGDTVSALAAGATTADLTQAGSTSEADAIVLEDLLNGTSVLQGAAPGDDVDAAVHVLLLQEHLNPATGTANGVNVARRQALRLLPAGGPEPRAQRLQDPVSGAWFVRVRWVPEDALRQNFCFTCECAGTLVRDLARFHGNLVFVTQGRPQETRFLPPGPNRLPEADEQRLRALSHAHWLRRQRPEGALKLDDAVVCALPPRAGVLAFRATPPDGLTPPRSTLSVRVSGFATPWSERSDLVRSRDDDEHFIVQVHENQTAQLRFGNGVNGRALPEDAEVQARWRSGQGLAGNVGPDTLLRHSGGVGRVWNPFDVTDGREPEPVSNLVRRAPEAYRRHQLRAVTLPDYAARAEAVPGVAHAKARYLHSGSWRVVRVAVDPVGGGALQPGLRARIAAHLDAVRLIGDDVELRAAEYVPLDIRVTVCALSGTWAEDLRVELEMAFSDATLPGGGRGLFHPDDWSFGQPLHASQIIGRAMAVPGVERVTRLGMRRFNPGSGGGTSVVEIDLEALPVSSAQRLDFGDFEIPIVANDPDHLERGRIAFDIRGGRR
ncbi:hypothetical protein D621_01560 [beta proteobacterium AAP51]|nr:hypothetical protein D621_01560 [beta proteobacterium AAP51]